MTVPASPAPAGRAAPSGYLMAAVALVVVAPLALAGWLAGAAASRSGRVSRGRLAAAAAVTGTLALLVIGPSVAAGGLLSAVTALGGVLPATLTAGAVLEALSAILGRGVGLAAVTVPVGILAATIPPRQDLAVRPEWAERGAPGPGPGRGPHPPPGRVGSRPRGHQPPLGWPWPSAWAAT